jgi:Kef-type K+ transport system membrane component KefB
MASLALIASLVVLVTLFIGPLAYLFARLNFPPLIVYILSGISILQGFWFCSIGLPIWYMGLIPIYFGYISIHRTRQKQIQG